MERHTQGIRFMESDVLTAGASVTTFKTPFATFGVGICYDLRFPQLATLMADHHGCDMLLYPGAFNTVTGPKHWELLQRARYAASRGDALLCSSCTHLTLHVFVLARSWSTTPSPHLFSQQGGGQPVLGGHCFASTRRGSLIPGVGTLYSRLSLGRGQGDLRREAGSDCWRGRSRGERKVQDERAAEGAEEDRHLHLCREGLTTLYDILVV